MNKQRKIKILKDLLVQLSDSANILCTCEADERCEVIEEYLNILKQPENDIYVNKYEVLDLIDRCYKDAWDSGDLAYDFKEGLETLTPVIPEKDWVPTNKKLPNRRGDHGYRDFSKWVQVTIRANLSANNPRDCFVCDAFYNFKTNNWVTRTSTTYSPELVTAWKPLPEPYIEEENERANNLDEDISR